MTDTPIIEQAFSTCLERIKDCESRIVALDYALAHVSRNQRLGDAARTEHSNIRAALYDHLNEAYRALLTFGILVPGEMQSKARRAVIKRYLSEGVQIMGYLQLDGQAPGQWWAADEEAFRKEIEEIRKAEGEVPAGATWTCEQCDNINPPNTNRCVNCQEAFA